jgi:hypothetical protein
MMMEDLGKMRPCGELVNEHSFILNHSPQDGKKFREALILLWKDLSETGRNAFRRWIVAGRNQLRGESHFLPSCGILEKKLRVQS